MKPKTAYGKFKVILKNHSHLNRIGECIDIIPGYLSVFKLKFDTGEVRGFTVSEIVPVMIEEHQE